MKKRFKILAVATFLTILYLFSVALSADCKEDNINTDLKNNKNHNANIVGTIDYDKMDFRVKNLKESKGNACKPNNQSEIKIIAVDTQLDDETGFGDTKQDLSETIDEQYSQIGADELLNYLPSGVEQALDETGTPSPSPDDMQNFSIGGFFKGMLQSAIDYIKTPATVMCGCFAVLLISALFEAFKESTSPNLSSVLGMVSSLAVAGIIISPVIGCVKYVTTTIHAFADFMLCFIPVFTGIIATSGAPTSSIGYNTALFALAQIITSITSDILLPFMGAFLALSVAGSINNQFKITGITSMVKKTSVITLSFLSTIFLGLFSIQSMVASSADNVGLKAAKFLSGSFVPVVGSALSDAFSSVVACMGVIKSSLGGFSILVCILTFVPPILTILFFLITLSITNAVAEFFKISSVNGVLTATKDALSILLAFIISTGVIIVITTALMLKLGGG